MARRFDLPLREAADHFEPQGGQEAFSDLNGACRTAALAMNKIAGDLRLLGSGPASGLGEVSVPNLQAGSSIMPGKVNPIVLEVVQQVAAQVVGNDAAVTFATTNATLELTTAMPVMARNLLSSIALCAKAADLLGEKGVALLEVNRQRMREHAIRSPSLVTALAPYIGYDRAAVIGKLMIEHGSTIEQAGRHELGDEAWDKLAVYVDPERMARPHMSGSGPDRSGAERSVVGVVASFPVAVGLLVPVGGGLDLILRHVHGDTSLDVVDAGDHSGGDQTLLTEDPETGVDHHVCCIGVVTGLVDLADPAVDRFDRVVDDLAARRHVRAVCPNSETWLRLHLEPRSCGNGIVTPRRFPSAEGRKRVARTGGRVWQAGWSGTHRHGQA